MPNRTARRIRIRSLLAALAAALFAAACAAAPLEPAQPSGSASFSDAELERLVAPIALYPDDLLAVVLPASTYPLDIVQAARFLQADADGAAADNAAADSAGADNAGADGISRPPNENWDESVIALLNYPEVIHDLNEDLDWTRELGQAMLYQQTALLAAVERFRARAHAAGNLQSDDRQTIVQAGRAIEIRPARPDILYVPYYEPRYVVIHHATPVYHYHPRAYPVYYYPYPAGHHFRERHFWGVTSAFSIGWNTRHLHVHHHHWPSHPYFGRSYHPRFYYRRPPVAVIPPPRGAPRHHPDSRWKPERRHADAPFRQQRPRRQERASVAPRASHRAALQVRPQAADMRQHQRPQPVAPARQHQRPRWAEPARPHARPQLSAPSRQAGQGRPAGQLRSPVTVDRAKRAPLATAPRQPPLGSRSAPNRIAPRAAPSAPRAATPPAGPAAQRPSTGGGFRHQGGRRGDNAPGRARIER